MSRTDKDDPWWLTATGVEERHLHLRHGCNLPPKPDANKPLRPVSWHRGYTTACYWYPTYDDKRNRVIWHSRSGVPKWFINHVSTAPTRVKVRDDCIKAKKEYRGSGEVDTMPPITQHRHCAAWLYW